MKNLKFLGVGILVRVGLFGIQYAIGSLISPEDTSMVVVAILVSIGVLLGETYLIGRGALDARK